MTIKGMPIVAAKDESRLKEVCDYIWSLNFKKPVRVDVAFYEDAVGVDAYVSKVRYAVRVNPNIELSEIKSYLLKKGYIID